MVPLLKKDVFVTGPDGTSISDLNSLRDLPEGVILPTATGINNVGQVVAIAMVPEPSSYALMLAGLALVGMISRRDDHSTQGVINHHHAPG